MSSISYSVGLDTSKFQGAIGIMRKGIGGIGSLMGGLSKALPVGALIGGIGGVTGALALLKKSSNLAADFESTSLAMGTLIGNAEKTKTVLEQIDALASSTPFEFPELAESGKMLIAFNESADTVADTLRRVGDVSSGIQAPIREIAELYGKARVQGTLFAEDINQMTGRGIPIIQELAKVLNVTDSEIKKLASDGKITFPMLQQAFINLTSEGGKFYNMMATQSASTNGLLSTLTDGWNKLLRTVGTPLNDWLRPQISGWIERLDSAGVRLSAFISLLRQAQSSGNLGDFLGAGLTVAFTEGINVFSSGIRGGVAFLAETIPGIFRSGMSFLSDSGFLIVLREAFRGIGEQFSAQILQTLSNVPGLGNLADNANASQNNANTAFGNLPFLTNALRFDKGIEASAKILRETMEKGAAAWKGANQERLIDNTAAKARLKELGESLNPEAYAELVTGESKRQAAIAETVKKAEGLDEALKKAGDSAEKTGKKISRDMFPGAIQSDSPDRPLRKIFMKKLRDGDPNAEQFVPGPDGLFVKAQAVQNAGRNSFGKNRPPREAKDKAPTIDPLTRIWTEIKETNRRLGELGLA
jgi:tape measure domain-containing protein